ncbi:MAG: protein kinase [Phycisphaera sp. RhM]|nr:protein kinase [Phycisphaera sp. RhM]
MVANRCPNEEMLSDFLLGRIDDASADQLESHIVACASCRTVLESSEPDDTLVSSLKLELGEGVFDDEPQLKTAMAALDDQYRESLERTSSPIEAGQGAVIETNLVGQQLGQYRLIGLLGRGGMGAVYKAEHLRLQMIVAVKVLSDKLSHDRQAIGRFEREMKAVGRIHHPNVVKATDAGVANGKHYLAMEFVEGTDLGRVVASRRWLSIADACETVRQAAIGLQHAHRHGLIHRDIKPSNLMVTGDGEVKVLDLGLARIQRGPEQVGLTDDFQVMGTADYMAPEQALNASGLDERADVYSLGCTLYTLLCGHPPFKQYAAPLRKLMAHDAESPSTVRQRRGEVAKELSAIVDRCLEKSPEDRFQDASKLAEALEPFSVDADLASLASGHQDMAGEIGLGEKSTQFEIQALIDTDRIAEPASRPTTPRRTVTVALAVLVAACFIVGLSLMFQRSVPNKQTVISKRTDATPTLTEFSERDIANWAIENQAIISLVAGNTHTFVANLGALPDDDFQIIGINFTQKFEPSELDFDRLARLHYLRLVEFQDLELRDHVIKGFSRLPIQVLRLRYDESRPQGLARMDELSGILNLTVGGTMVGDEAVKQVSTLSNISSLTMSGTEVTNAGLRDLAKMRQLTFLSLVLTQVTAEDLHVLDDLELWALHLAYTQVSDQGLQHLAKFDQLKWLGLGATQISDDGLRHLRGLRELTTLSLHETDVTSAGLVHLQLLPNLRELEVGATQIDDRAVEPLLKLHRLTRLELGDQLTAKAIAELKSGLPGCRIAATPRIRAP